MLHPVWYHDAKGVCGLAVTRLKEMDVSHCEPEPLVSGVLRAKLLQCGVVQLPLDLTGESILKCKGW